MNQTKAIHQQNRTRFFLVLSIALFVLVALATPQALRLLRTTAQPAEASVNTVAPSALAAEAVAVLLLDSDALALSTAGDSTALMVQVRDEAGQPVELAEIRFSAILGNVTGSAVTDATGRAAITFNAGSEPGTATITAEVNGLLREAKIQIAHPNNSAENHSLQLDQVADTLDHNQQINVGATLRDDAGRPVSNELVSFFGALGNVEPASAVTDSSGRVAVTYTAGTVSGQANITALAGYVSSSASLRVGEVTSAPATETPTPTTRPTDIPQAPATPIPGGTSGQEQLYLPLVAN